MASNDYVFQARWRIEVTLDDVFRVIEETDDYQRWWGRV
jgi:hypothetical protein